jgi:hypothetical protein
MEVAAAVATLPFVDLKFQNLEGVLPKCDLRGLDQTGRSRAVILLCFARPQGSRGRSPSQC